MLSRGGQRDMTKGRRLSRLATAAMAVTSRGARARSLFVEPHDPAHVHFEHDAGNHMVKVPGGTMTIAEAAAAARATSSR